MSQFQCPSCGLRIAAAQPPPSCPRCLIRSRERFELFPVAGPGQALAGAGPSSGDVARAREALQHFAGSGARDVNR